MPLTGKALWNGVKDWFWITIGLALYACAWNMFVLPHGFVGGGFGGISAMLYYVTDIPVFIWYLGFNVILCSIAYAILGKEFSIKTVFGILILSGFLAIIPIPEEPILSEKLLSGIMGGIVAGAGIATYLLRGASTGGSDIVVLIVSKYKNVSWGRVYLIFDACVIAMSYFLPDGDLEKVAYGYVFMGVSAYALDIISNGRRQSVQMFIFTSKYREIADQIIHRHHRGATLFESIGWYTKQHRKTIYLVARKRESQAIFKTVKEIDSHAFIAVSNVMSVFGIGFDAIKAGFTKPELKDANGNTVDLKNLKDEPTPEITSSDPDSARFATMKLPGAPQEIGVSQDMDILNDENAGLDRLAHGREAEYNPNWETPVSELMEIPEMPMIPKDMAKHAVQHYESSANYPKVEP